MDENDPIHLLVEDSSALLMSRGAPNIPQLHIIGSGLGEGATIVMNLGRRRERREEGGKGGGRWVRLTRMARDSTPLTLTSTVQPIVQEGLPRTSP